MAEKPIISGYLSSLGKYAEGRPAGEWVGFPTTAEHMKEAFARIGLDFKNYEEWHFTEFQSSVPRLAENLPEHAHPDELNYLSALLSAMDGGEREKFAAAAQHGEYAGNLQDLINLAQNLDCYELVPDVLDEGDYGHYLIDELETIKLPEEAKPYFDYEGYGGDTIINQGGELTRFGYIYNNRSPFTEHYNGRDVPEEYRVTPTPPEPEREGPDFEAAAPAAPRPVAPILLASDKPGDKMKEITGRLEQGIMDVFASERYADYLRTMSHFHEYSLNNTILIAMQGGRMVRGFQQWQNEFDRHVKAGEKAIKILAPAPYTVKKQVTKRDPATGQPVIGKDGKPVTEEQDVKIPAFRVVSVFDVSQTEGKELPTLNDSLTGGVENYRDFFTALERTSPFPIGFDTLPVGTKGRCDYEEQRIIINEGMDEVQNVKTAIHEITHATLHDTGSDVLSEDSGRPDKRTREIQAESVAYVVCQHYGIDTADYSFGYIAGWSGGKELAELKSSLETIRSTAAKLIDTIDGHLAELQQERTQVQDAQQTAPVFEALSPEKQKELSDTVAATLQTLIDADRAAHGEVTAGTLDAIQAQGYSYQDGRLTKAEPQPDAPRQEAEEAPPVAEAPAPQEAAEKAEAPAVHYYAINEGAARRANDVNSYYDYRPGSATAEYRRQVDEAAELAQRQKARVDPMYHEKIDGLLDAYARRLAANLNKHYEIEGRVPSILVAGGSNFPVGKKRKQNDARDTNMHEWQEVQGLLDKIRSAGMGGISADDPQAVQKLESKLAKLEKAQETMKAVNAYYRKYKTLDGCPHLSPEGIEKMKAEMSSQWHIEDKPYPTWALSNNNAEIRRLKERIKSLSAQRKIGFVGWEFDGGKVEANPDANRLQIFFDDKPDEAAREELKSSGFRWSPKAGAWQRQLTDNAYYAANSIAAIAPLSGEKPTDILRAHIRQAKEQPQAGPEYIYKVHANPRSDSRGNLSLLQAYLPQQDGTAKIGDVLYIGTPEKCRELMEQLNTGELTQGQVKELYAKAQEQPTQDGNSFTIYQLKRGDETRDYRYMAYDDLKAAGLVVDRGNYEAVYTAPLTPEMSLEDIFTRFNIDHPADFKGHSLSVSDIVVLHQGGQDAAHYVDSAGFRQVPEFTDPALTPDSRETGEQIRTPRGSFYVTAMSQEQMEAAGYGFHHQSEDGKHLIMGNGTRVFAIPAQPENYLKAAEQTTEQNYNMIDGQINNAPTAAEIEARAQAGEQISLTDYAKALKAEQAQGRSAPKEKPSIREQLAAAKAQAAARKKTVAKTKNHEMEV